MQKIFLLKDEKGNITKEYSKIKIIITISIVLFLLFFILFYIFSNKSIKYDKIGAYVKTEHLTDLKYRTGNCLGYIGGYWDDAKNSFLASKAGLNTQRKKFPENHMEKYGIKIEVDDCKENVKLGINEIIAYLATPSSSHSKNPNQAENFPPLNLYEKIWNENGTVNQNNYWAYYIYKIVQTYKDFVKIYEVYNEPDYTKNYNIINNWYKEPPDPQDLPHWNSDIFEYIRLLRVTYEVVKKYHPEAYVATGGLGYESFLDCIMRYTDNPNGGTISDEYPSYGGAYFDCESFHKYPKYGTKDIQTNFTYNKVASDNFALNMMTLKKNHEFIIRKYGFDGKKYPEKIYICSESGVDSTGKFGSDLIRRNFNLKAPLYAIEYNIKQLHYFTTADYNNEGNGDYYPGIGSKTKDNYYELMKPSTKARLVLNHFNIYKMEFDKKKTDDFRKKLPNNVTGIVLKKKFEPEGNETIYDYLYSVWVEALDNENVKNIEIELEFDFMVNKTNYQIYTERFGKSGKVMINNTPIFFYPNGEKASSNIVLFVVIGIVFVCIGVVSFIYYKKRKLNSNSGIKN